MAIEWWVLAGEVDITTSNRRIVFQEDGVASDINADLAVGTYYLKGDGSADDLALAVKTALDGSAGVNTYTINYNGRYANGAKNGTVTIGTSGTSVKLISSGTTFSLPQIGFSQADTSFGATLTNDISTSHTWTSDQPLVSDHLVEDRADYSVFMTKARNRYFFQASDREEILDIPFELVEPTRTLEKRATADSDGGRAFQSWWRNMLGGKRIQPHKNTASTSVLIATLAASDSLGTYVLREESAKTFAPVRLDDGSEVYGWTLQLAPYVA